MVKMMNRIWIAVMALTAIMAGVALIIYLVVALNWRNQPFAGVFFTPTMTVDSMQALSNETWAGWQHGLKQQDRIISVNDTLLYPDAAYHNAAAARQALRQVLAQLSVGDTITVEFNQAVADQPCPANPGEIGQCRISYALSNLPDIDWLGVFIVPFVTSVIVFSLGLVLLWLRGDQPAGRLSSLIMFTMAVIIGGLFDLDTTHALIPVWIIAGLMLAAGLIAVSLEFPVRAAVIFRHPRLTYLPFALMLLPAPLLLYEYDNPAHPNYQPHVTPLIMIIIGLVFMVATMLYQRRYALTPTVRDQSNTLLLGLVFTSVPMLMWLVNVFIQTVLQTDTLSFNTSAVIPFVITLPFSLTYALLEYRAFNTDRALSNSFTYIMMIAVLTTGYGLLVMGLSLALTSEQSFLSNSPVLIGLTVLIVATTFTPVRNFLQRRIDALYYRQRTDYQQRVENFSRQIASLRTLPDVTTEFRQTLTQTLHPTDVIIFIPDQQTGRYHALPEGGTRQTDISFEPNTPIIYALEAQNPLIFTQGQGWPNGLQVESTRLGILNAIVIAGLRGSQGTEGFICIGPPQSGAGRYSHEELLFIENLVGQMSIAAERAQVVESLERRVQELDVLGQVGQAVNFAIHLDDLLELLSAQTNRLIAATYFYIALYESSSQELYFAFFLEDDERYTENENQRWRIGTDPFSTVVRTGQPLRIQDYATSQADRRSPVALVDQDLYAWMGVPLTAGASMLGVMAVATQTPGQAYTDEQLKIFSDISSLAATSIEKARLFSETNNRARQLAALNDISNQLAREQQHVDKLLELITISAVDILEAQAGSLLLTTDDGSGDLEFRIAIGEAGAELVGRRFPAGEGLVGEVAATGRYIIVNNPEEDTRWAGELTTGIFQTHSVLAVPLIANNQTLGVLEVINKKDRSLFVDEDANLLNTFAGQAAIALDNARLFEMTDMQLSIRVNELETMERIDVELNRSLDISTVADITVRWAVLQSGATAGALGIVQGDTLQIVARHGYRQDEAPPDAEEDRWSLHTGIISRVMRTRQPDIASDTSIDPDYIPGQKGALSQITVPMMSGDEINALLILEKNTEPRLGLVDLAFVQRLAEHASIALVNAQLYVDLARANASKSEFVSFVAHELKTPMTSIKGYTDLLLGGITGEVNAQQESFLSTIKANIERMDTLVSDLNDITKLQTGNFHMEMKPTDIRAVIDETLRPFAQQLKEKGHTLDMKMADDLPQVYADHNRLLQVLTNLISNAYKYTPPNGRIIIYADRDSATPSSNGTAQHMMHIYVQDNGIGMSEEDLAKLFTPYFRSENPLAREQPGTGLGLTITRGIIEGHGGQMWVESTLGTGTAFHITLPLFTADETAPASGSGQHER